MDTRLLSAPSRLRAELDASIFAPRYDGLLPRIDPPRKLTAAELETVLLPYETFDANYLEDSR